MRLQDITILREAKEDQIQLAKLPYKMTELAPILSEDNVKYHYNVLTKGYVNRYNAGEGDPDFGRAVRAGDPPEHALSLIHI